RFAAAAACLLDLATVATPFALQHFDPDRSLKEITRELAQGRPVTLIGESGRPMWYRWSTEDTQAKVFHSPDGTFAVHAWDVGLLELLPDPQWDSYRFSVEVRQDLTAEQQGRVGIYFLHGKYSPPEPEPVHCYCALLYGELNKPPQRPKLLKLTRE